MKLLGLKSLGFILFSLLVSGCNADWVWDPSPGPISDISGTVVLLDSLGRNPLPDNRSGIPVLVTTEYYPFTVLDSTHTDENGYWKISNVPSGDDAIVIARPGFSAYVQNMHMPIPEFNRYDTISESEGLGIAMNHPVVLDSVTPDPRNPDSSFFIYGHDPSAAFPPFGGWNILVCSDTARGIPAVGAHLSSEFADRYGEPESHDAGAFSDEVEVTERSAKSDSLYIVAYTVNPIEREELFYTSSPLAPGFRTSGPVSNVIAIPRR
jgi:hypothetical protein